MTITEEEGEIPGNPKWVLRAKWYSGEAAGRQMMVWAVASPCPQCLSGPLSLCNVICWVEAVLDLLSLIWSRGAGPCRDWSSEMGDRGAWGGRQRREPSENWACCDRSEEGNGHFLVPPACPFQL